MSNCEAGPWNSSTKPCSTLSWRVRAGTAVGASFIGCAALGARVNAVTSFWLPDSGSPKLDASVLRFDGGADYCAPTPTCPLNPAKSAVKK